MQAAAQAILKRTAGPHYVGGRVGVLAVLHTWGSTLSYHPHVHCKPAVQGTERVREYLGRYLHRVARTNSRILSIEDGKVAFRYRQSRAGQTKTLTLDAQEFLRRFLPHGPPRGVHKVRYHGLWSPSHRDPLHSWQDRRTPASAPQPPRSPGVPVEQIPSPPAARPCPYCQTGTRVWVRRLPPQGGPPP